MRYLLDTNVISEPARPRPEPGVVEWLASRSPLDVAISVLTLGEIRAGVRRMAPSERRAGLETWLAVELPRRFLGRVLAVDEGVAEQWGDLSAEARTSGRPLPVVDGLLLATAAVHGLVLVTRNERDCAERGVELLNPWRASAGG